jgi:hypothetical protein
MRRNCRGSGIVEGVIGLLVVIGGAVGGTLMVLNSGAGIFFKEKLVIVTSMAAQYAAAHSSDSNLQSEVTEYAQKLMMQCGMAPSNMEVVLTNPATFTVNGQPQTGVSVAVNNKFPLFGNGSLLPAQIQMGDTEFASAGGSGGAGGPYVGVIVAGHVPGPNNSTQDALIPVIYVGGNGQNTSLLDTPYTTPPLPSQFNGLPIIFPNSGTLGGVIGHLPGGEGH